MSEQEEYKKAVHLAKSKKICGEDRGGCQSLLEKKDMVRCEYWGQVSYWCQDCWKKVKDD